MMVPVTRSQKKSKNKKKKKIKRTSIKTKKQLKNKKKSKQSKNKKNKKRMKECLQKYKDLPSFEKKGGLTYIDVNSKGCRVLHAYFARSNSDHCPHITFEAEEDINGLVKCNESKADPLTDFFSARELGLFTYAATMVGLPESGIEIKEEACII